MSDAFGPWVKTGHWKLIRGVGLFETKEVKSISVLFYMQKKPGNRTPLLFQQKRKPGPANARKKLQAKCLKLIYIGVPGYLLFDQDSQKTYISCDVVFDEGSGAAEKDSDPQKDSSPQQERESVKQNPVENSGRMAGRTGISSGRDRNWA